MSVDGMHIPLGEYGGLSMVQFCLLNAVADGHCWKCRRRQATTARYLFDVPFLMCDPCAQPPQETENPWTR